MHPAALLNVSAPRVMRMALTAQTSSMGQHYVPQQYLRGFEAPDEPGTIWTYDKLSKQFRQIPITAVAQEAQYYDAATEQELSDLLEGPAHASLAKLRRREALSADDRLRLAVYVATMMMRVPRRRRKALELMPSVLNTTVEKVRARIEEWGKNPNTDQGLVARRLAEVDAAHQKLSREPPNSVLDQIRSPWPSEQMVGLLSGMTWRIATTAGAQRFLTSDNPAYFFEAYGLGKPDAEVTFPLSSDLALLASWQGPQETLITIEAKTALVKEVNRRVASGAERFVFYHERCAWIATLADKAHPYLSRIQW